MIRRKPVRSGEDSPERRSESVEPAEPERPFPRGKSEPRGPAGSIEVACPDVYNIRFSAGKSLKEKLVRFGEVLGIDCTARRMPEIFEKALDLALEKKDPKQKLERRKKREAARAKTRPDEANPPKTRPDEEAGAKKREARTGSPTGSAGVPPASFSVLTTTIVDETAGRPPARRTRLGREWRCDGHRDRPAGASRRSPRV